MGKELSMLVEPEAETTGSRGGITSKDPPLASGFPDMSFSQKPLK